MWFRTNSFRILKLFFDEPDREFYLREIARLAKISPASVHQIMKELEKMKVVRREKTPAIDKFKANALARQKNSVSTYLQQARGFLNFYIMLSRKRFGFVEHSPREEIQEKKGYKSML